MIEVRRNPYARDVIDAVDLGALDPYIVARELRYLAGVGALEYLRHAADVLHVPLPSLELDLEPVPPSRYIPLHAFVVYAEAEARVADALPRLGDREIETLSGLLVDLIPLLTHRRAVLLTKSKRFIAGRGEWLRVRQATVASEPSVPMGAVASLGSKSRADSRACEPVGAASLAPRRAA